MKARYVAPFLGLIFTASLPTSASPPAKASAATLPRKVVALFVRITDAALVENFDQLLDDNGVAATFVAAKSGSVAKGTAAALDTHGHLLAVSEGAQAARETAAARLKADVARPCWNGNGAKQTEKCVDHYLDAIAKDRGAILEITETTPASLTFLRSLIAELDARDYRIIRADLIPDLAMTLWRRGGIPGEPPGGIRPPAEGAADFMLPPLPKSEQTEAQNIWATWYRIHQAKDQSGKYPLLSYAGTPLGPRLALADWCAAALEGTVRVVRRRGPAVTYNHADLRTLLPSDQEKIDCNHQEDYRGLRPKDQARLDRARFEVAPDPFGEGTAGALVPYRTIAVGRKEKFYGKVLYIPAARGAKVTGADGKKHVHDGYFFAGDEGVGIFGNHLDVFIGDTDGENNPFTFVRSKPDQTFPAYIVSDPKILAMMEKVHRWRETMP